MRTRPHPGSAPLLAAALLIGSPAAVSAATPRHKPARAGAAPKKGAAHDPPPDSADEKSGAASAAEKPASPSDKPAPPADEPRPPAPGPDEPPATPPAAPVADSVDKPSAAATATTVGDSVASTDDAQTLGRREAARIAARRIEVAVLVAGGIASRHFTYRDAVGRRLAPYRLPVAPMASFGVEAYPAASSDVPVLRDLGLRGDFSRGFGFDSNTPQGVTLQTSWTRFGGELRERTLLAGPHAFELGVFAGLDASYFTITSRRPVPALFPTARTVAVRLGFDAQLLIAWRLSLMLGGAYLIPTTAGEVYDHFRKPKLAGVDADFGAAIDVAPGFQARLTGRYTRYFAAFKPALGDRFVAGGALDQQMQFGLGARYAH